jgi:hypothetical protein
MTVKNVEGQNCKEDKTLKGKMVNLSFCLFALLPD